MKVLEIFLPKCPAVNIVYKAEDVDAYKVIDGSITVMEDITKVDETAYVFILLMLLTLLILFILLDRNIQPCNRQST